MRPPAIFAVRAVNTALADLLPPELGIVIAERVAHDVLVLTPGDEPPRGILAADTVTRSRHAHAHTRQLIRYDTLSA